MWATYLQAYVKLDECIALLTFLHVPHKSDFPGSVLPIKLTNIQYMLKLNGPTIGVVFAKRAGWPLAALFG